MCDAIDSSPCNPPEQPLQTPQRASVAPVSPVAAELGRRVRERRNQLGISQEKLADLAGLHWTFVGQVERGRRNLTLHNIVKLARALDIDPGQLMTGLSSISVSDRVLP